MNFHCPGLIIFNDKLTAMYNLVKPGRIFFAIGIIALGILSIVAGDFITGRPPGWPAAIPGKLIWAIISGTVFVIAGIAIILHKKAGPASLVIGLIIFIYSFLFRHLPAMFTNDWEGILWSLNAYKTLALSGGAFIVAASFFKKEGSPINRFISNEKLVFTGIIFLSFFLIIAGCSHFKFAQFVIDFIPAYIPFHAFWTYFCAIALLAGGVGILIKQTRKLAATLSGLMIFGWFILLHIPRFINAPGDPSDRMGLCESLAISGILFVLAGMSSKENTRQ